MEYLGLLSLGAAIAGIGVRCYFSMREKAALASESERPLSSHARRTKEAMIARRFLRHHRGLAHA